MTDRAELPARLRHDALYLRNRTGATLHTIANDCDEAAARIEVLEAALQGFVTFLGGYCGSLNTRGAGIEIDRLVRVGRSALTPESSQ